LQHTGVTYNCIETYTTADPTWADWVNPWITSISEPFVAWVAADPTQHQLIDTQNLIPDSEETNSNWTAECAAGDYNSYATQFATSMIEAGLGYSVIRLGIEMNGTWNNDSLGTTVAEWQQWGQCFAQEVTAMRAAPGANFLFDWNVNANYRDIPLADFYPGNAYVDIIGIDAYDDTGVSIPAVGQSGRFHALASEPDGLYAVEAFAVANGKPLSIPEWGTLSTRGDDAAYVTSMANLVASDDVAFQTWFNAGVEDVYQLNPAQAPLSLAAYVAAFG
jgi:beta-mannanase